MTRAAFAYANARMRARKARLLGRDALVHLAVSERPAAVVDGWRDLVSESDGGELLASVYARLMAEYACVARACPAAERVVVALARRHEIENVKLVWRAAVRGRAFVDWQASWRPLGAFETVTRDACRGAATLPALAGVLSHTPFRAIADVVSRVHPRDLAAAAAAFDRWVVREMAVAADALPPTESMTRRLLAVAVSTERDATARRRRDSLCQRAFRAAPYSLAPLVAYLLMRDAEARALLAVAEARARELNPREVYGLVNAVM